MSMLLSWRATKYQIAIRSLFKRVSMSTRQIGQCLLVVSHWSTQSMWNRCMHGNRRTSFSTSNKDKQIVHFSPSSSSSSGWRRTRLYLWGNVFRSMVSYHKHKDKFQISQVKCDKLLMKLTNWNIYHGSTAHTHMQIITNNADKLTETATMQKWMRQICARSIFTCSSHLIINETFKGFFCLKISCIFWIL